MIQIINQCKLTVFNLTLLKQSVYFYFLASAKMDYVLQTIPLSTNTSLIPLPTHLSNSIGIPNTSIDSEPRSLTICLDPPKLITEPKDKWHPRTIEELKVRKNPLLSGEGRQRTPIRVEVTNFIHSKLENDDMKHFILGSG